MVRFQNGIRAVVVACKGQVAEREVAAVSVPRVDRQRRQPGSFDTPVEPTSITAQLLPLRTVTSFAVTRIYHRSQIGPIGDYIEDFTALQIAIGFGQSSETVGIATMFDDQAKRERWEEFVAAARAATMNG